MSRGPLFGLGIGVVAGALVAGFLAPAAPLAEPLVDGDPEARATTLPTVPVRPPPGSDDVLLAWTPGRLPKGIDTAVGALPGVTGVASVSLDLLSVIETVSAKGAEVDTAPPGLVYPLEAIALNPLEYRRFLPETERTLLDGLRRGGAWLGTTSAAIRRLGPGGLLRLPDGDELTVTAVVPDDVIGAAEVVISQANGRSLGVVTPRYLLISYEGDRLAVEAAIRSAFGVLPGTSPGAGRDALLAIRRCGAPPEPDQGAVRRVRLQHARREVVRAGPRMGCGEHRHHRIALAGAGDLSSNRRPPRPQRHGRAEEAGSRFARSPRRVRRVLEPPSHCGGQGHLPPRLGRGARHQLGRKPHRDRFRSRTPAWSMPWSSRVSPGVVPGSSPTPPTSNG